MIETIIVLLCAPLEDYKFRDYSELAVYANELKITHYEDERVFDIKGLAKGPDDGSECFWVSISPY